MTVVTVTTSVRPTAALEMRARALADELHAPYAQRHNETVTHVFHESEADRLLVVADERMILWDRETGTEYFFHPNMAMVRAVNLQAGRRDLFAESTALVPGEHHLDCTVGFAGEATIASLLVGESGRVVGLESIPELAAVTRAGVAQFPLQARALRTALRRIEIVRADNRDFLAACGSCEFDVVYFDPFFADTLRGSENSVSPLAAFGDHRPLGIDAVREARRVARRRVVIKCPRNADLETDIAAMVSFTVYGRKGRVVYHVIATGA
ncbi:MAG: class I SAM-dependent methyltransferase [Capsulimonadaceae bacterium]